MTSIVVISVSLHSFIISFAAFFSLCLLIIVLFYQILFGIVLICLQYLCFLPELFVLTFRLSFPFFLHQVLPFFSDIFLTVSRGCSNSGFCFCWFTSCYCLICLTVFSMCSGLKFFIFTAIS